MKRKNRDHMVATATRIALSTAGVLAGLLIVRSLPDLVRYMKIIRM